MLSLNKKLKVQIGVYFKALAPVAAQQSKRFEINGFESFLALSLFSVMIFQVTHTHGGVSTDYVRCKAWNETSITATEWIKPPSSPLRL